MMQMDVKLRFAVGAGLMLSLPLWGLGCSSTPKPSDSSVTAGDMGGDAGVQTSDQGTGNTNDPLSVDLEGGTAVEGDRPASSVDTAALSAAQVANFVLNPATAGQALNGSFEFTDPDNDVKDLIVQVLGAAKHYVWAVSTDELTNKKIDLSKIKLTAKFTAGTRLIYLALRDAAGNVSTYLTGTLVVGSGGALSLCTDSAKLPPFQLVSAILSRDTGYYTQKNGVSKEYVAAGSQPLTVIGQARVFVSVGPCTKLTIAGDAAGTKPVGWDNLLLIEYRSKPGGDVEKRWYYGSYDDPGVTHTPSETKMTQAAPPTVAGTEVGVPNGAPFGHAAKAIDLMSQIPQGVTSFELTLNVFDYGSVGSTTDIWGFAE